MSLSKEALVDFKEKFDKVQKLIQEDSKHDPITDPYLSKYAAKHILLGMEENIKNALLTAEEDGEVKKIQTYMALLHLNLGIIHIETEESGVGESYLCSCVEAMEPHRLDAEVVLILKTALNQLGCLWSMREDAQKTKEYLDRSETLYHDFKKLNLAPIDTLDIFIDAEDVDKLKGELNLEKTHTLTLYYLAQIYGSLGDDLKSAVLCHITLERQLQYEDYDPIDWALNAATLSQYFTEKIGFKQARNHLAAASYILDKYEEEMENINMEDEVRAAKLETFRHRSADVARCWAKYGLCLLQISWERLLKHAEDEDNAMPCPMATDMAKLQLKDDSTVLTKDLCNLCFESIDLTKYESQIVDNFLLTFEDVKKVFLSIQSWLNKSKEYYTIDNLASEYALIVQDISQIYKYLAYFEDDEDSQCKMHKRRIDQLEDLVKQLNPTYYQQICQQVWNELALTYSTILDIKTDKLKRSESRPTPHALTKINSLTDKSISNYNKFLASFQNTITKKVPDQFPKEVETSVLEAHFLIARLYNKYITSDKNVQIENIRSSLEHYNFFVSYCEKHEAAAENMKVELNVSQEMSNLLPLKIQKLTQEMIQ